MTEPRNNQGDEKTDPKADGEQELNPEVIQDLDVSSDDADALRGGDVGCRVNTYTH